VVWGTAVRDRSQAGSVVWGNAVRDRSQAGSVVWGNAARDRHGKAGNQSNVSSEAIDLNAQ
jgi:hypothetical protein